MYEQLRGVCLWSKTNIDCEKACLFCFIEHHDLLHAEDKIQTKNMTPGLGGSKSRPLVLTHGEWYGISGEERDRGTDGSEGTPSHPLTLQPTYHKKHFHMYRNTACFFFHQKL